MKLKIRDIPPEGTDFTARGESEPWFAKILQESFCENYRSGSMATLDLHILKTCDNVSLSGLARIDINPACDRCLESFERHLAIPVHVDLTPSDGTETEDLNFAFYKGDELDFSDILREILLLEVPIRYLCQESCKGLCPQCGQNRNKGDCSCTTKLSLKS